MSKPYYIKAKRQKTIVFLCYQPTDSLEQLKANLCKALDNGKTSKDIKLFLDTDKPDEYIPLEDTKSLENISVINFVYFDQDKGQWEPVNVVQPQLDDDMEDVEPASVVAKKEKGKKKA
ncbi:hypothetical protein G6F70_000815 [Rhizopus microsporus]|uniref:Uncharacterized protein n=2 Tax=Rhizopus TaxID=4842 RepID=A0A367JM59_RHIAZ|nr:hypothetical protein G6F71_003214 [Rhizopus microsporus]RCH91016.1 hypothetical protein CU097_008165 [Rhizopus azygosporus]KAG1204067.1 hypothetical protein G6F70_000815 [Rhizopus microsporus]KAG1214330.1 hypothetical protein G6F69_002037 [Rhizopus microsporus]KAG1237033.1 hypothetical protein G6F67_001521 [Rhizopus microsporus]